MEEYFDNMHAAIKDAEAAMKAPAAKQPAPAVKAVAKKLVPAKKAPAKAKGSKSGRDDIPHLIP